MSATNGDSSSNKSASAVPEDIGNADESIEINGKATLKQNLTEVDIEKQKLMNDYREELTKIQEDIATLRLVLNDKLKRENELKQLLGVSFVEEIKADFSEGLNSIKSSNAYQKAAQALSGISTTMAQNEAVQKTTASLKTATQKITPTFSTLGGSMKNSLGSLKNSSMYKSFEAGFGLSGQSRMKNSQSEFQVPNEHPNE